MSSVTPPRAGVPIGHAVIDGRRVQVTVDTEYLRFFAAMIDRVGGPVGPGTNDLSTAQFEDAGIEETKALLHIAADAAAQDVNHLRETVQAMDRRIVALEQGISL